MKTRTNRKTVTFGGAFVLGGLDRELPAGAYVVETDEELIEGLSFPAWRRVATLIHLPAMPAHPGRTETLSVDPTVLDAALSRDATWKDDRQALDRAEYEGMTRRRT
jgi:hypothetical protein